jgi:catechol 2,3-dioxygenase-like lactoylglutathione lyase family enzyme
MASALCLNHLNLPARDPAALGQWYVDTLGFQRDGRFLWSGGTLLVFIEGDPVDGDVVHFGFRVASMDDLVAWVRALRARGVEVGEIEGDSTYSTVFVRDPEGNRLEIFFQPDPV